MAKRSREIGSSALSTPPGKIREYDRRTHQQNQERAYTAASRRTDRSIEARMQSARMASAIHKKRTGRGFKLSEEIVLNEEMYEEEEEEPSQRYLAISDQIMRESVRARQQQIDNLFAKEFPHISRLSRHMAHSMWPLRMLLATGRATTESQEKWCPPVHSKDTQSFPDSFPLRHPWLETTPYNQPGEDPSLPALTPPSCESDSPSSSAPSPAPSLGMGPLLFSTNISLPDETQSVSMHAAELPTDINLSVGDANTANLLLQSDIIQPINEVCYSIAETPITSAPSVHAAPSELVNPTIQSSDELDTLGLTSNDGNIWETWLDPDFLRAENND